MALYTLHNFPKPGAPLRKPFASPGVAWTKQNAVAQGTMKSKCHHQYSDINVSSSLEKIPGFQHLLNSKNIYFKIIWLFIVLLSFCTCCYQIYDRHKFYTSQPTNTKVSVTLSKEIKFPSFTFCPRYDQYGPLVPDQKELAKKQGKSDFCSVPIKDLIDSHIIDAELLWKKMNMEDTITVKMIHFLSVDPYINSTPITTFSSTLTEFGNCTTINIPPLKTVGSNIRLRISIDITKNLCPKPPIVGLYQFHNTDEDVIYKSRDIIAVVKNQYFMYDFSVEKFYQVNTTNDVCKTPKELNECRKKCIEDHFSTKLPCRLTFMNISNLTVCSNGEQLVHAHKEVIRAVQTLNFNCNCSKSCEETLYIRNLISASARKDSSSRFDFYFGNNIVIKFEEYVFYSFISLLCDVGGNLGLFMGLCIITIIDLVQEVTVAAVRQIFTK